MPEPSAIVIDTRDNVATALRPLAAGEPLDIGGRPVIAVDAIPVGHKIAIASIGAGNAVLKYGNAIGQATSAIGIGAHVHTHNVASTRGRGDLGSDPRPDGRPGEASR